MKELDIPGAVVTLVRHDRVIMNRGFGLADVARRIPVDADSTEFRVASVAKVFTALAVLQQVENGKVRMNADIRPLLSDFGNRLGDRPLTLHELLTHTAGFDEQMMGYMKPVGAPVQSLTAYLSSSMPPRPRADSAVPGYSNHSYGLAGLVVERLAGQPFAQHAEARVFRPLGLQHTRFVLMPDDSALTHLALEYRSDGTVRTRRSTRAYPAGNIATTGADMAVFLRWLLTALAGEGVDSRIASQMIGPMLTYHSALPSMGYGFSGVPLAGRTVWMKGGAGPSHSALMAIIPELDIGLFIALNRQEPLLWDRLMPALARQFWADPTRVDPPAPEVRSISGTYRWTRAPLASPERVFGLAAQLQVSADEQGLVVKGPELGGRYERRAADRFESSSGHPLAVRVNERGDAEYLFSIVQGQPVSFERIAWYETTPFQLGLIAGATLLALCAALATLRRRRAADDVPSPTWAKFAVRALPIVEIVTIVVALQLARQTDRLQEGPTPLYRIVLALATLFALIGLAQAAGSFVLASRPRTSRTRRVLLGAGTLAGIGFAWLLTWNHLVFPF